MAYDMDDILNDEYNLDKGLDAGSYEVEITKAETKEWPSGGKYIGFQAKILNGPTQANGREAAGQNCFPQVNVPGGDWDSPDYTPGQNSKMSTEQNKQFQKGMFQSFLKAIGWSREDGTDFRNEQQYVGLTATVKIYYRKNKETEEVSTFPSFNWVEKRRT